MSLTVPENQIVALLGGHGSGKSTTLNAVSGFLRPAAGTITFAGRRYLGAAPAKTAVKRIKGRIRQILRPGNRGPWGEVREELNRAVRGWAHYFSYGTRSQAYRAVDRYVHERTRYFLRRRHKVPSRGTRRFTADRVFGELGVFQLRRFQLERPAHARV